MVLNGLLTLLRVEGDKIGAAPCKGFLHTLVEGIKPFVVRLRVKVLITCFPIRPLRSSCVSCRDYRMLLPMHFILNLCWPRD